MTTTTDGINKNRNRQNDDSSMQYIIIIIIITNEKIKVMLSRKRCRGTLQDYNKGEISNVSQNCGRIEMSSAGVWMERGRKQFEEMVVDCSMRAVQRRGKHDHLG